ncbi:MAG TPA: hypothetical protein VGM69_24745 [Chloroflexota bacterium]
MSPGQPSGSGRREIAGYLRASSPPLQAAIEAQRELGRQLSPLYVRANEGHAAEVAERARALGKRQGQLFRTQLERVEKIVPPPAARRGDEYLRRWLRFLIMACDALASAPDGGDTTYLGDCHDYVDDARYAAKALSTIRKRLRDALARPSTDAAPKPPRAAGQTPARRQPA